MSQYSSDTAYIRTNPDCIGEHFIKARGEIFEHIAQIANEMGTIAKSASNAEVKHARKSKVGEWYQNVVSILGERGSGKTILLLSACACLGHDKDTYSGSEREKKCEKIRQKVDGDILLPIIQPEYFGQEDTLITWILTYLKGYIEDKNKKNQFKAVKIEQDDDSDDNANNDDVGIKPLEFIEEMRRDEALFSRKFSSHLAEQDVTAVDFQRETLKVVDSQDRFMRNWRKLVNGLIVKDEKHRYRSVATKREEHPFLIIPIDDADLNPSALPIILQQMQILQHPNVLFLFSAHEKSLRSMMYISQLELNTNQADTRPVVNFTNLIQHGFRSMEDVRIDTTNKIEKILPRKYRVRIQPLSLEERLNFKPLVKSEQSDVEMIEVEVKTITTTPDGTKTEKVEKNWVKKEKVGCDDNDNNVSTFLQLLERIPLNIFGDKRSEDLAQFFNLAQAFKRCPSLGISENCEKLCVMNSNSAHPCAFASLCVLYSKQPGTVSHGWVPHCFSQRKEQNRHRSEVLHEDKNEDEIRQKAKKRAETCGVLSPFPSFYIDMLPRYPRTMEQMYQILYHCVFFDIMPIKKEYDRLKEKKEAEHQTTTEVEKIIEIEKEFVKVEKALREKVSQSVKTLESRSKPH